MNRDAGASQYRVARDAIAVRIDDDTLIWDPAAEQLHHLNAPATRVWEALHEWATTDTVIARLGRGGGMDIGQLRQCVNELYDIGVLERRTRTANQAPSSPSGD